MITFEAGPSHDQGQRSSLPSELWEREFCTGNGGKASGHGLERCCREGQRSWPQNTELARKHLETRPDTKQRHLRGLGQRQTPYSCTHPAPFPRTPALTTAEHNPRAASPPLGPLPHPPAPSRGCGPAHSPRPPPLAVAQPNLPLRPLSLDGGAAGSRSAMLCVARVPRGGAAHARGRAPRGREERPAERGGRAGRMRGAGGGAAGRARRDN